MALTVSQLREREHAECAYALFIEGIPYVWVTDHPNDALLGSGSGSWIGVSEAEIGLPEAAGQREVLPGLKMPGNIQIGELDIKTGMLESAQASFEIVDFGGELLDMFATEGKEFESLAEVIPPGTALLGSTVIITKGTSADTIDPRGKHIGIEKIDVGGRRRQFPVWPFGQMIGYQHAPGEAIVGLSDDRPPMVTVSDSPLDFAGRPVALYRLYRDTSSSSTGYTAWPTWRDQYSAGGLVWWGTLRDAGELSGDRTWKLNCKGPDSLLRRRLGSLTPRQPRAITSADINLTSGERFIAVIPYGRAADVENNVNFKYLSATNSVKLTATNDGPGYATEISDILVDVLDGSITNMEGDEVDGNTFMDVFIGSPSCVTHVRRTSDEYDDGGLQVGAEIKICLHEKVWRVMGYEPALQAQQKTDSEQYVNFDEASGLDAAPAQPDYWWGTFYSCSIEKLENGPDRDNDGHAYKWNPIYEGGAGILVREAGQIIRFNLNPMFLEGSPTVALDGVGEIGGETVDQARYFAFKGKRLAGTVTSNGYVYTDTGGTIAGVEHEDYIQVARCSWSAVGGYGTVLEDDLGVALYIEEWVDPKTFGFNYKSLANDPGGSEWVFLPGEGEFGIQVYPLNTYAYAVGESQDFEHAGAVLSQLLLSTGTAGGYSDPIEDLPSFSTGDNGDSATYSFQQLQGGDCELADMGLGIPHQLVAPVASFRQVFDEVSADMARVRYAYAGPFDSWATIKSLVQSRGLMLTLRGRRYGVTKLEPFPLDEYDVEITQNDLWGEQGEPGSIRPRQQMRAVGQLDKTTFSYDWEPVEGSLSAEQKFLSIDPGTIRRPGDLALDVEEHGLRRDGPWFGRAWELWAVERPRYFAQRHFLVTNLTVNRIKGQDLHVGTKVLFTNPWVVAPTSTGYTGVVKAGAIVTKVDLRGKDHAYDVELLVFAGQFGGGWRHFAPIGRIRRISGTEVELYPDEEFLGHGLGSDADKMWVEPGFSDLGGNAEVAIIEYDRKTWSISSTATVSAVDPDNHIITLATTFSPTPKRDKDKLLVLVNRDSQSAAWVNQLFLPVVLDTHQYGSGPTKGLPFNDKKK